MTVHKFTDVRAHHLVPTRQSKHTVEVMACACGATYRSGMMYPPFGVPGEPYDREAAIEADLAQVGIDSIRESLATHHGQRLATHGDTHPA